MSPATMRDLITSVPVESVEELTVMSTGTARVGESYPLHRQLPLKNVVVGIALGSGFPSACGVGSVLTAYGHDTAITVPQAARRGVVLVDWVGIPSPFSIQLAGCPDCAIAGVVALPASTGAYEPFEARNPARDQSWVSMAEGLYANSRYMTHDEREEYEEMTRVLNRPLSKPIKRPPGA